MDVILSRKVGLAWCFAAATLALLTNGPVGAQTAVEIGKPFPEFTFPSIRDGQPISIRQFVGQKTILMQFASW